VCHRALTLRKLSGVVLFSPGLPGATPIPARYADCVTFPARAVRSLFLVVLLAATPALARAEFWAAISGGAYIPTGTSPFGSFQARPTASLAVGYDSEYVGGSVWAGIVTTQAGILLQENCFPVVGRVRLRLPLGMAVPYVYGGVGFAPARAMLDLVEFNTVAFTAQAGAGVDVLFSDMFTVGAEGGYLWLSPSYSFGTVHLDGFLALATFGLRFP